MEIQVRDVSETVAELTLQRSAEEVRREFDKHYKELQKELELPGFRKGKVPRTVLKRRFGKDMEADLAREMAGEMLEEALAEKKLRPVGEPAVESMSIEEGQPFRFVVRIEHLPHFNLARYKGLAPPAAEMEVTDAELQKQLRTLQLREGERTDVDRPAQAGDHVEGRFRIYVNDVLDGGSEELDKPLELVVGEDHLFTGTHFDLKIVGHKVGERFRIEGETPLAYAVERYRGRRVALDTELTKVQELKVPALDDAFTTERFKKSLAELSEEVRKQLLERKQKEDREQRLEVVFEKLRGENSFAVPEAMLRMEMAREEEQWNKYNVSEAEREELRRTQMPRVERKVRNALLLQRVIELERFDVSDADLRKRYEAMAPFFGKGPAEVAQFYQSQPRLQRSLKDDILESKALDFLLESTPSLIVEV
jgi:trigger factor